MRFQPKTEEEIQTANLLPDGKYGFVISNAEEKVSASGNDMIVLTVRVYKDDGGFILITDYLMEKMAFKLRHACQACDLLADYDAGELDHNKFVGKEGFVKIKTQPAKGEYSAKNVIADYVVGEEFKPPKDNLSKALDGDELEDKIPWSLAIGFILPAILLANSLMA